MTTAGLNEMDGLSADCGWASAPPVGFCVGGAVGAVAVCALNEAERQSKPRQTDTATCATLVRNNLKNNCIVQLRILLRQRCWYFNFKTVRHRRAHPRL